MTSTDEPAPEESIKSEPNVEQPVAAKSSEEGPIDNMIALLREQLINRTNIDKDQIKRLTDLIDRGRVRYTPAIVAAFLLFITAINVLADFHDILDLFGIRSASHARIADPHPVATSNEVVDKLIESLRQSQSDVVESARQQAQFAHEITMTALQRTALAEPDGAQSSGTAMTSPAGKRSGFAPYVWAQLNPDQVVGGPAPGGGRLVRAVVPGDAECPQMTVGGVFVSFESRDPIYAANFPIRICETASPVAAQEEVVVGGRPLPARADRVNRILVLGDTGCRVTFFTFQHCKDAAKWPFPRLAQAAAREKADLILHVGDYHYRERPCPAGTGDTCGSGPGGYLWSAWRDDFFEPARELLGSAPWVFVRGNHENCQRAGDGWTDFFWPELFQSRLKYCVDSHKPYVVKLAPDLSLAVLDVANAEDEKVHGENGKVENRAEVFGGWMRDLAGLATGGSLWLAMHQPPWQWPWKDDAPTSTGLRSATVKPIQDALLSQSPPVNVVFSGDTHVFEVLLPSDDGLPAVIVNGMSGTERDKTDGFRPGLGTGGSAMHVGDADVTAYAMFDFGYTIVERRDTGWVATMHDVEGKPVYACSLAPRGACTTATDAASAGSEPLPVPAEGTTGFEIAPGRSGGQTF